MSRKAGCGHEKGSYLDTEIHNGAVPAGDTRHGSNCLDGSQTLIDHNRTDHSTSWGACSILRSTSGVEKRCDPADTRRRYLWGILPGWECDSESREPLIKIVFSPKEHISIDQTLLTGINDVPQSN